MKKAVTVIVWVILAVVFAAGVFVLYRYTNGFNEDFKTFYIARDGEKLLASKSSATFEPGDKVRFDVGYIFDGIEPVARDYQVKILPNPEADFDFEADDLSFAWRMTEGLDEYFSLDKQASSFTFTIPMMNGIEDVLRALFRANIDLGSSFPAGADPATPFFLLRVSSYNSAVTYEIAFSVHGNTAGYTVTFNSVPGGNGWMTKVVCPTHANPGETVSFSWEWSSKSPYQELQSVVVETESGTPVTVSSENGWHFTMPEENVRITVTYGHTVHGSVEPETGYTVTFNSVPGGNGWMTKVVCPAYAKPGETVSFSWEWSSESPYQELQSIVVETVSGTPVSWSWTDDYSCCRFLMPEENVRITVTYGHTMHGG